MLHRLELADGLAELLARLGVLHRDFHDALHAAYHFRRQRHRGDGQGALQSGARGIANRQEILFGDRDVFKRNLVEFARFVDGRERGDRQAARAAGHDKQAQVRAAARRANQEVRSGGGGRGAGGPGGGRGGQNPSWMGMNGARAFGNARRNPRMAYNGGLSVQESNSLLNAQTYSLTGQNIPKPYSNRTTTTITLGGPLRIPHILNPQRMGQFHLSIGLALTRTAPAARH